MATEKDIALVQFILDSTKNGKIQWESTALDYEFTTTFKGKYKAMLERGPSNHCHLSLYNEADEYLLSVSDSEFYPVADLYEMVRRKALNVDSVIDEILGSPPTKISDDDIPF
jgi:hypothetical protein